MTVPIIPVSENAASRSTERALAILEHLGRFRKGQSASEILQAMKLTWPRDWKAFIAYRW